MKTFVTISAGVLLALSCVATSDARLHANREGQTQSEPSNYNPDSTTIRITIAKQTRGTGIIPAFIVEPRLGLHRLCPPTAYRHRRIKWQCLAPPSKWPKSLCPPISQGGFTLRRSKSCYSGRAT